MRLCRVLPGFALVIALCLAGGCGGDGATLIAAADPTGGVIDDGGATMLSGEWETNASEVVDTCGFDPPPSYSPLWVEEAGASVLFTFADGYGNCEQSVRERQGDTVVLHRSDTIEAGCGTVRVQSNIVYEFEESTVSGRATHQYSVLEGGCSNLPCTYQLSVAGGRCDGCWPGCGSTAAAEVAAAEAGASGTCTFDAPQRD